MAEESATSNAAEGSFLETVRKRYKLCIDAERDNRDRAREALAFRDLEQWDAKTKHDRETDPEGARPCLVVDKLNQHIQQVVNDERLNRPQIKVRPVDDKGDIEVAKILDGIIRHIQDRSHADVAFDTGFEQAVDGGFGYWRILTEYCDPESFDQDIRIARLRNRFAVYLDPQRQEPDGSDAQYGFIFYRLSKDDFKAEFGDKAESALTEFEYSGKEFTDWYGSDWVAYAEYFWIEKKKERICQLTNGQVVRKSDYTPEQLAAAGLAIAVNEKGKPIERETEVKSVRWRKVTGTAILEEGTWAGDCIPIVEVIGNEIDIEGRVMRSGMIRPAMDAQRVDNYATSAFIENVALAPRAPWTAAAGQLEGYEDLWRTANRRNISVLPYKPVSIDGVIVPPPQRLPPPGLSTGWLSVMEQSQHNIQAAMGRYNATLGAPSNETSGKAITARNREGDMGSFHFSDNLSRSLRHTGKILIDPIPKIFDTRRVARIIGEDGTPSQAIIDPDLADENGQPIAYAKRKNEQGKIEEIYNPGVGKYDVTVAVGPSFTTRRLESADAMMEISRGNPEFMARFGDIIFKSQDWPGADQIAERFKKMLPPELKEQEEGDDPEAELARKEAQVQSAVQALGQREAELNAMQEQIQQARQGAGEQEQKAKDAMARVEQAIAKLNEQKTKLEAEAQSLNAERELNDLRGQLARKEIEAEQAELQADRDRIAAELRAMKAEADAQIKLLDDHPAGENVRQGLETLRAEMTQALTMVLQAASAPRRSMLEFDENGEPVGSVSVLEVQP